MSLLQRNTFRYVSCVSAILAFSFSSGPPAMAQRPGGAIDLQNFIPVLLAPGTTQAYNVWTELRSPQPTQGKTLLITISGVTFDHRYWDAPGGPSFVNAAVRNGFAVLNIDRLGIGYSSRPPADALSYQQGAFAIHQLVAAVSSGPLKQFGFARVVLVGHSYGSTLSISEAATFRDVSAIVLTGVTHTPGSGVRQFAASVVPAEQDPAIALQGYPPGDATLVAGSLGPLFFYPETSFAAAIATSESTKGVFAPTELASINDLFAGQVGEGAVNVPVLTVFGDKDVLFGDTGTQQRLQAEPGIYSASPSSNVAAIPQTGHALALSTTAAVTDEVIFSWLRQH